MSQSYSSKIKSDLNLNTKMKVEIKKWDFMVFCEVKKLRIKFDGSHVRILYVVIIVLLNTLCHS